MATLLEGLFGLRPNLESQQENMQVDRGMGFGELLGRAGVNPYAPKAVQDAYLGRQAATGALVGKAMNTAAGLFGIETPELQRAKSMESILQQTQADTDINNPNEFYPTLARRMAEGGHTQASIQIGQVGAKAIQDFNLNTSTIGKNNAQARKAGEAQLASIEQQIVLYANKEANEGLTEKEAKQYKALVQMKDTNSGKRFSNVAKGGSIFDAETQTFKTATGGGSEKSNSWLDEVEIQKDQLRNYETGRVESVPGSKLHTEQKADFTKTYKDAKATIANSEDALTKLKDLNSDEKGFERNFGGYNAMITKNTPGAGLNYKTKLEGISANMRQIGLSFIRQGGSIGQITEREWPMIEAAFAKLSSNLNEEDAKFQFKIIENRFNKVIAASKDSYKTQWGDTQFYKSLDGKETPSEDAPQVYLQPSGMSNEDWAEYQASQGGV